MKWLMHMGTKCFTYQIEAVYEKIALHRYRMSVVNCEEHVNCCHRSTCVCSGEQQWNCSSVCSQWVKHVVLHSSREDTTEQIIMIQNIVTPWIGATLQPSVLCPCTAGHFCICICVCMCVWQVILDITQTVLHMLWKPLLLAPYRC